MMLSKNEQLCQKLRLDCFHLAHLIMTVKLGWVRYVHQNNLSGDQMITLM